MDIVKKKNSLKNNKKLRRMAKEEREYRKHNKGERRVGAASREMADGVG